jgi:hypothetical protein
MALPVETNAAQVAAETNSQAYYLDLLSRLLPGSYLSALITPGPGYELLQAFAALAARASLATARCDIGSLIRTAAGGQKAQALVAFSRPDASHGAVTVLAGTIVTTSNGDRRFALLRDVVFGASDTGPIAGTVEAILPGYEWNVPGPKLTATGEVLPGDIDTIELPLQSPPFGDPTIVVEQTADSQGGMAQQLDGLGRDRDLDRSPGETDAHYRSRISTLPDTVSPGAILRAATALLGFTPTMVETWDAAYQTCWDGPSTTFPPPSHYNPNLFAFDDARTTTFSDRWLDEVDYRGAFFIILPALPAIRDVGMAYDDTAETPAALLTTLGGRATNAYDVPFDYSAARMGGYDGFDPGAASLYSGLWAVLQKIRAAGVTAGVELLNDHSQNDVPGLSDWP